MFSRAELAADFRKLGLQSGNTVMLHASVRSVGKIAGGPDQIHLALMDAISPGGTIMMYAGCPRFFDEVGRGRLTPQEEAEILAKMPSFDPVNDKADQENGALVEFFRTYPDTIPSQNIGRMIARGSKAEFLMSNAPQNYGFGANSPLEKFKAANGKIVLLGSDHDQVTFLHYVEHVTDFPDKKIARYKVPYLIDGQRQWIDVEEVNTAGDGAHANWPDRFFASITDGFLAATGNSSGKVGNSTTHVLDASQLQNYAAPIMNAVAQGRPAVYAHPRNKSIPKRFPRP